MPKKKSIEWTLDQCLASAHKYQSPLHWKVKNAAAYNVALESGWLNTCFPNAKERKGWTLDDCVAAAVSSGSKEQWIHNNPLSYKAAVEHGWLEDCMRAVPTSVVNWTLEMCQMSAIHYDSMLEWQRGAPKAYKTAKRNKWLEECCRHMDRLYGGRLVGSSSTLGHQDLEISGIEMPF